MTMVASAGRKGGEQMEIGVVGLGENAEIVIESLLRKTAHNLFVYDPDKEDCAQHVTICQTAAELCERCEVVFLLLETAADLTALCNSIMPFIQEGCILIDLTDISPALAHTISNGMRRHGAAYIDCGIFGAKGMQDPFILFAGGNSETFARVQPLLRCFAPDLHYMGPAGRGKAVRLFCRALALRMQESIAQTAALADAFGIKKEYFLDSLAAFGKVAHPLASFSGGEPAILDERLEVDAQLVTEMAYRAQSLKEKPNRDKK